MKRPFLIAISVVLLSLVIPFTVTASTNTGGFDPGDIALQHISIPFVENLNQFPGEVAFYARTFGGTLFVTDKGKLVLTVPVAKGEGYEQTVIREEVVGGVQVVPKGLEPSITKISRIIGSDPAKWERGVNSYNTVYLGEVYEGIELRLKAYGNSVEKVFTARPGADPARIRVKAEGITELTVTDDGRLSMQTPLGAVTYSTPVAYQDTDTGIDHIQVAYVVHGDTYGFELGPYDKERPLVIDPILLSTYLGGSADDTGWSLAFDSSGNVYITGRTYSTDFPGVDASSAQISKLGSVDIFVARFNPGLNVLYHATYLGGTGWEEPGTGDGGGPSIAVNSTTGNVYVTGWTSSSNFPGVANGYQNTKASTNDAYVAVLENSLNSIIRSTYFGGNGDDLATAVAIHPQSGDVCITGRTRSTDLPGVSGGAQESHQADTWDGFAACLSGDLTPLRQATYLGGAGEDWPFGITIYDKAGEAYYGSVYITGQTGSTSFPYANVNTVDLGGGTDAFVTYLPGDLSQIVWAHRIGGTGGDRGYSVKVHPVTGEVYVSGDTSSTDFPGTDSFAAQPDLGGSSDGFISNMSAGLSVQHKATYFGGSNSETGGTLAINPTTGRVYLVGNTMSTDIPGTTGGAQIANAGDMDVYAAMHSASLFTLHQATYVGGSSRDMGYAVGVGPFIGEVYVTGLTWSHNLPGITSTLSAQSSHGGGNQDGYVVRMDATLTATASPDINVSPLSVDFGSAEVDTVVTRNINIQNRWGADLTVNDITITDPRNFSFDIDSGAGACSSYATTPGLFQLPPTESCLVSVSFHPRDTGSFLADLTILSDDLDEGQVDVELTGMGTVTAPCWDVSIVDDGVEDVDIAVDNDNNVHMCYFISQPSGADTLVLRYATLASGEASVWIYTDLDTFLPNPLFALDYTQGDQLTQCSIAVGTDGLVQIAYSDSEAERLKYAWGDGESGFTIMEVSRGEQGEIKINLDGSNNPHIVYRSSLVSSPYPDWGVLYAAGTPGSFNIRDVSGLMGVLGFGLSSDVHGGRVLVGGILYKDSTTEELRISCADLRLQSEFGTFWREAYCVVSGESVEFEVTAGGSYYAGLDNFVGYVDFNSWAPDYYNLNLEGWSSYPNGDLTLAVDSLENAHLLYFEQVNDRLTHTEISGNLLSTFNMDAPVSTQWEDAYHQVTTTVASSLLDIRRSSMDLDSSDIPHLAFLDGEDGKVKYAVPAVEGCEILSVSPARWRFDDRGPGSPDIRPFFVTNLGDAALSVQAIDFQDLTGLPTEVFETVDCISQASDIPALQLGASIPGGETRAYCVHLAEQDLVDYRGLMILQSENGPITIDLAADSPTASDSSRKSSSCNMLPDNKSADVKSVLILIAFVLGLLLWRRRRLG